MTITISFVLAYMTFCFIVCIWQKNNGIVDVFWGLGFVLVAWLNYFLQKDNNVAQFIFNCLITLWGLRLSIFLAFRNVGKEEDFRYATWRREWGNNFYLRTFLQIHMLQGFFMFIIALPIVFINSAPFYDQRLLFLIIIGMLVMSCGIFIEGVADRQKQMFRRKEDNPKLFIANGLWKFSRHPNYFGEVLVWIGVFLISVPFGKWFFSIVSPLVITFLILKISGIPMLEKKYEDNELYQQYKKKTSSFILKLPKVN